MVDLTALLRLLNDTNGSDLHLVVGAQPSIRVDGELRRVQGPLLLPADTSGVAHVIMPPDRRERFENANEADFAYSVAGIGRFRVNAYRQRGSVTLILRRVRLGSASFAELNLPAALRTLADLPRGLLLVTGPTGSGKTTTLAAMIDHINATKPVHILTVEDPIEVLYRHQMANVTQREVGVDTDSYVEAMRSAMRQDPDVILIGEMRDTETVAAALAAAETGHLVLSTLHTNDAVETVNRIVDFFPPFQQHQARITLASVLKGVICQRLVQKTGGGRVPALEILISNGRVAQRIIDPKTTGEINQIIAEGELYGMQSFDQSLLSLIRDGLVTVERAMDASSNPHDLKLALEQAGLMNGPVRPVAAAATP